MSSQPKRVVLVISLIITAFACFILLGQGLSVQAQVENCQTFPETGFKVCDKFLDYWKKNGGLAQQGLPVSIVFEELNAAPPAGDGKLHKVQYFQRARFEEHLENQPPYDTLLGLLGSEQTKVKYGTKPFPVAKPLTGDCQTFPETGFKVCGRFLEYWNKNGGLAQQGFPVSDVFDELNAPPPSGDGKIHRVQYFQRARFEEHTENQPPYDVLLGLLGSEQYTSKYGNKPPLPPVTVRPLPTTPASGGGGPECLGSYSSTDTLAQACVSNDKPARGSDVTLYARLIVNGKPVPNADLSSTWNYKSKQSECNGTADNNGLATCTLDIGTASKGYFVRIDVYMSDNGNSYLKTTGFTPQ